MSDHDYNGYTDTLSADYEEPESRIVLCIETLTGTAFEMMVSPSDTVLSIKNRIQNDEGIPTAQQHLLLGDRELSDTSRLGEQGIGRGTTLRLVLGMHGGPINTRCTSARADHLVWREIKEFVEATKDDMKNKGSGSSKITLLVYREGETINLLKVVENEDGSYSPLSESRTGRSGGAGSSMFSTMGGSSVGEAIRGSSRRRGLGNSRTSAAVGSDRLRLDATTRAKLVELRKRMEALSVRRGRSQKQWVNADFYDAPVWQNDSSSLSDSSDEGNLSSSCRLFHSKPAPIKPCTLPPIGSLFDDPSLARGETSSVGDKTTKILAEYYPQVTRTKSDFNRQPLMRAQRKSKSEQTVTAVAGVTSEETEEDERGVHGASSIAIVEEETAVSANESLVSTGACAVSAGRTRLVLSERPKSSPDQLGRRLYEFILGDTDVRSKRIDVLYEPKSRDSTHPARLKRTKGRPDSLDIAPERTHTRINKQYETWIDNAPGDRASRVPLYSRKSTKGLSGIRNRAYEESSEETIAATSSSFFSSGDSTTKSRRRPIETTEPEPETETLPMLPPLPAANKKLARTRCKQCHKRLNITTVHSCRCGDTFCAQHRYSEVHGCQYDYKTEGRRALQEANPPVLASKLPKI